MQKSFFKRVVKPFLLVIAGLIFIGWILFKYTPYPATYLIRYAFDKGGVQANGALAKFVPSGIIAKMDLIYNLDDKDGKLDIHLPEAAIKSGKKLPLIVWVHGGACIFINKSRRFTLVLRPL